MATKKAAERAAKKAGKAAKRPAARKKTTARKSVPKKRAPKKKTAAAKVRVRMYRQGLGDCFLLTFLTGAAPFHLLIDCGTLGATTTGNKMADVVANIAEETNSHLHLLIATHEHKDHVSGFASEQGQFDAFTVDEVWNAWTEDSRDELAQQVAKHKGDLVEAVALAANAFHAAPTASPSVSKAAAQTRDVLSGLLDFVGAGPGTDGLFSAGLAKTVHAAMTYVTTRAKKNVKFLEPGDHVEPKGVPGVRFYVLGPPRDAKKLRNMGEHGSADLYGMTAAFSQSLAASAKFAAAPKTLSAYRAALDTQDRQQFESGLPFDPRFHIDVSDEKRASRQFPEYYDAASDWRRVDHDWLDGASDLALQLDSYTNNTSLALAIELVADGRVLLFPADAQLGNWLSWHEHTWTVQDSHGKERTVKAPDLLRNTVFYKAGHHASHNATATSKGLELMEHDDLVVMIPLDRKVAMNKSPPWLMPAEVLYRRLVEKARGRVVRSDTGWPEDADRPSSMSVAAWKAARAAAPVTEDPLYYEYTLR